MRIYRQNNGRRVAYTLSRVELSKAYDEQQHIYDVGDIKNDLETDSEYYAEKYGLDKKPVTNTEIEQMALRLRRYLDSDADNTWSVCVRDAIEHTLVERDYTC